MADLKVGDRVRLSTGVEAICIHDYSSDVYLETPDGGELGWLSMIERAGISWDVVDPELVEPPLGSVIRFNSTIAIQSNSTSVAIRNDFGGDKFHWTIDASGEIYSWENLVEEHGFTEFEVLRPEREVVKEVLEAVREQETEFIGEAVMLVAEEYWVEL